MTDRVAAEVFPPGEFVKEELEARGWNQNDLAKILGRPPRLVSEIVTGKRAISPETAKGLGEAFSTGAQFWMNLESAYQLHRVKASDKAVALRAQLYALAPVGDMIRRHWIEDSDNVEVLEKQVLDFFEIKNLHEEPSLRSRAARKSTSYESLTTAQKAWFFRAKHLSRCVQVRAFTEKRLSQCLDRLRQLLHNSLEVRHVPPVLAEAGIRLVIVEHLPQTKIDGWCFWLDDSSPVISLSLRYDRIDYFWHTLLHEVGHVRQKDGRSSFQPPDTNFFDKTPPGETKPAAEKAADKFAASFLVDQSKLRHFIARVRPLYSKRKIAGFANCIGVHPGLVVGQLQHSEEISYAHSRETLAKVRQIIIESALSDGWGYSPPTNLDLSP